MSKTRDPGVELAALPRDLVGPFLLLGARKNADAEEIEARWAQCVLWARQGKTAVSLGDIHWARAVLRDIDRRLAADVNSLNTEVAGDELHRLAKSFHLDDGRPAWTPLDPDPLPVRPEDLPDAAGILAALPNPDFTIEFPAIDRWLTEFANAEIDPWSIPHQSQSRKEEDDNE